MQEDKEQQVIQQDDGEPKDNRARTIRRLLVFQFKLMIDALRDIALSPVSLVLSIIDISQARYGKDSNFEKLMVFGRNTEQKINLFEQHDQESDSIDSILNEVENIIVKEYKDKHLSKKTYNAIEKIINRP
jgi:hypothetical protein